MAGFFEVIVGPLPEVKRRLLQGAGKGEGNGPGIRATCNNSGEVFGGLVGSLTAREEDDAGEIFGDVGAEDFGSGVGDFVGCGGLVVGFAGEDHVAFQDTGS